MRHAICHNLVLISLMFAFFALTAMPVFGQSKAFENGSRALQFKVRSDLTLGSFEGAMFSGKYHLSQKRAVRFGVTLDGSKGTGAEDSYLERDRSIYIEKIWEIENKDFNSFSVDLTAHYIFYALPKNKINFYLGVGPHAGFSRYDSESDVEKTIERVDETIDTTWNENYISRNYTKTWEVGVSSIVGVEWFASDNISFLAEYGILIDYLKNKHVISNDYGYYPDPYYYYDEYARDESSINLSSSMVKLGLAVYF